MTFKGPFNPNYYMIQIESLKYLDREWPNFEVLSSHISYQTWLGGFSFKIHFSFLSIFFFPKKRKNIKKQTFSLSLDTFQGEISKHIFSDKKFLRNIPSRLLWFDQYSTCFSVFHCSYSTWHKPLNNPPARS